MKYLYFKGSFCSPCKQLTPIMMNLQKQGIKVQIIDVDEDYYTVEEWDVRSVPTTVLVSGGGFELNRTIGVQPESFYVNLYNKHNNNLA